MSATNDNTGSDAPATISFRVDEDLNSAIVTEIEESPYEIPKSEVVRAALREYLSGKA